LRNTSWLINQINEKDPSFLSDLETAITSNNANQVEMVIDRGNALLEVLPVLQNNSLDSRVEEQLANINTSDYDFTNEADVQKFVNAIHGIVNSNPIHSDRPIEEMGMERCIVRHLVFVYSVAVIATRLAVIPHEERSGATSDVTNGDSFVKEKLVSEILSLN